MENIKRRKCFLCHSVHWSVLVYSYSKGFQTNCPKNCLKVFVQKLPSIISREQQWTKPACESLPSLLLLAQRGQKQKMLPSLTIIQQQKHRLLFWKEWEEVKEQVAGGNKTQYTNAMQSVVLDHVLWIGFTAHDPNSKIKAHILTQQFELFKKNRLKLPSVK